MHTEIVDITLAFLEGIALILSPCILPILPIMLSTSVTGSPKRPIGIMIGFVGIFTLFTIFSRQLIQYSGLSPNLIRYLAYIILMMLGSIMISTRLTELFTDFTTRFITKLNINTQRTAKSDLFAGILLGGLMAIIWTPCAGPILAAAIVQVAIQKTTYLSFLTLIAFGLGASLPLLMLTLASRWMVKQLNYLKKHTTTIQKTLGTLIIFTVAYLFLSDQGFIFIQPAQKNSSLTTTRLQKALLIPYASPPIAGIEAWINSPPLDLQQLKGHVVLIDFWTYSCINCVRTLPYLNDWYQKYHQHGLIIIGVHTPEFEFEKNINNVQAAIKHYQITYPVALDNYFVTWRNFHNTYWPAHYLIDKHGKVVYAHFGEGENQVTENNIRYLLGMRDTTHITTNKKLSISALNTPETYLGYARSTHFSSQESMVKDQNAIYAFPTSLPLNHWALQGEWQIAPDCIVSTQSNAAIKIHFHARNVFIVMGNATVKPSHVRLSLSTPKKLPAWGKDVIHRNIEVKRDTLYEAVSLDEATDGILTILATSPGLKIYTFTFG